MPDYVASAVASLVLSSKHARGCGGYALQRLIIALGRSISHVAHVIVSARFLIHDLLQFTAVYGHGSRLHKGDDQLEPCRRLVLFLQLHNNPVILISFNSKSPFYTTGPNSKKYRYVVLQVTENARLQFSLKCTINRLVAYILKPKVCTFCHLHNDTFVWGWETLQQSPRSRSWIVNGFRGGTKGKEGRKRRGEGCFTIWLSPMSTAHSCWAGRECVAAVIAA